MLPKDKALRDIDQSGLCPGQRWTSVANNTTYTIVATGVAEATLSPVVVYAGPDGVVWVRSLEMFMSASHDGSPRFVRAVNQERDLDTAPFQKSSWRPQDGFEERPT